MTNFEKIKKMPVEEFAIKLDEIQDCRDDDCPAKRDGCYLHCKESIVEWLNEEAEEQNDDER